MLTDAAFVLIGAVTLGALVAVVQLQAPGRPPIPWAVALLHGVLGAAGLAMVLAAPAVAHGGAATGTTGFRATAVVLLLVALGLGMLILWTRIRRRPLSFTLVGVHALFAISGVVMLGAYLALA